MHRHSSAISFLYITITIFFSLHLPSSNGQQISTACTALLIKSFTPCLNYLTGSTNGGGSPSSECCKSLGSLISSSTQCACLIVTGSVPLGLPINRTLAFSLPRLCKGTSVPLQCSTDVGTPLSSPGTVSDSPSLSPLPPQSNSPPAGVVDTQPPSVSPSSRSPTTIQSPPSNSNTPSDQGLQPLILPNSAWKISTVHASLVAMSVLGIIYLF